MELLTNGSRVGTCLVVLMGGAWAEPARTRFVPVEQPPAMAAAEARVMPALRSWATQRASSTRLIEVHRLSTDFRAASRLVSRPLPATLPPGAVLIRRLWSGINASDVNYSAGRWVEGEESGGGWACWQRRLFAGARSISSIHTTSPSHLLRRYFGSEKAAAARLPFPAGFEAVGCVAATGPGVEGLVPGQPCATMTCE